MSTKWYLIILLALGLITRFAFFGHPSETVFDEVHFGKFVSGYYTREYFFDIHPPLGKLTIAGFAKLFGFQPGFAFTDIGNKFPDNQHLILRFLPSLAGALLPLVIYFLIHEMGLAPMYAFLGGMLIVFENALLAQSHYILLDAFLLLFGFMAILFYFKSKNNPPLAIRYWLLFGFFGGLAISVKWTGLGFLALPLLFEFIETIWTRNFKKIITILMPSLALAVFVYSAIFLSHLIIINKSGPGDSFMSQGFQKTLTGNKVPVSEPENSPPKSNLIQKFIELNAEMYKANQRLNALHSYSSSWYTWPLMTRPIYYWVKENSRIYLIGNPIIWWLSTVAIIYYVLNIMYYGLKTILHTTSYFLLAGYIINMLPFVGVKRVMFLYHYFTAYIFAILMMVWLISQISSTKLTTNKTPNSSTWFTTGIIIGVLLTISIASFIFFAPLSYGLDLSPKAYELRVWLASWR